MSKKSAAKDWHAEEKRIADNADSVDIYTLLTYDVERRLRGVSTELERIGHTAAANKVEVARILLDEAHTLISCQ